MRLIDLSVRRPVAVLAGVLIVMLLGWLSLTSIPIQLTPDVRKPLIIVETAWRAGRGRAGNRQPPGRSAERPRRA